MFEVDIITRLLSQKRDYLSYTIIFHCHLCGTPIKTTWEDMLLKGDFKAGDTYWSEYLDCVVNDYFNITCLNCLKSKGYK